MYLKLKNLLLHPTIKNLSIVTTGNIFNSILGFGAIILISRNLGPEQFGIFSVIFGLFTLISKLGDLGGNATAIKYISYFKQKQDTKSEKQVAGFFLGITYLFIVLVFLLVAPFYNQIAALLNVKGYETWVFVAIISSAGLIMFNTYSVIFQALEQFSNYVYAYTYTSLFKILAIVFLIPLSYLTLKTSLGIYFLSPVVGYLILFFILSKTFKYKIKPNLQKKALNKMTPFLYFMAISSIVGAVSEQISVFFSNIFFTSYDTGLLSSANRVSMVFIVIAGSVGTVLIPRASKYTDLKNIKQFAKKSFLLGLVLFLLCIPVILFPKIVIMLTSGPQYLQASNLLIILTISSALVVLRASFSGVFFSLNKGQYFAYISIINLILEIPTTFILADIFGLIGIVYAKLLISIIFLIYSVLYYLFSLKAHAK